MHWQLKGLILSMHNINNKHGGTRPGAGKQKSGNPEAKTRSIRLTDAEYLKFKALGGVKWLRDILYKII